VKMDIQKQEKPDYSDIDTMEISDFAKQELKEARSRRLGTDE